MTPQDFANAYLPTAAEVSSGTGIDPRVLLAQWARETAWGTAWAGAPCNLGNIETSLGVFAQYATLDEFAVACIAVFHNGLYWPVLAATTPADQLAAIIASPWDVDHYPGGLDPYYQPLEAVLAILDDIYDMLRVGTTADGTAGVLDALRTGVLPPGAPAPGAGSPVVFATKAELDQAVTSILNAIKAIPSSGATPEPPEPAEPKTLTFTVPAQTITGTVA